MQSQQDTPSPLTDSRLVSIRNLSETQEALDEPPTLPDDIAKHIQALYGLAYALDASHYREPPDGAVYEGLIEALLNTINVLEEGLVRRLLLPAEPPDGVG